MRVAPAIFPLRVAALAATLGIAGCGGVACQSVSIVVADREERSRIDMTPHGFRTGATGRLEEAREPSIIREYWVRSEQGAWFRVSPQEYRLAQTGRSIAICQ